MCKFFRLSFIALCLVVGMSAGVLAQSTTDGAIGGVVKDPQGAVVANAAVTVLNEETNRESTATTDDEGRFRVVQLQPGNYTVTVTATGFTTARQQKVVVEVGRVTSLDLPLTVGGTSEIVEVTSEAPVINTTQQDFSTNINQTSINELPINGRRWSNFALLAPGAALDGTFGLISFRGISGLLNNNTVDGGDNNQAFFSEERGRTRISYVVSQSAIREFQVNTSNYSAEYGRAAGGVVNAVTKSGTNEFHGDLFYYQRNNKWGARNPLATQVVQLSSGAFDVVGIKPKDVRHQFGGTIGGPIVKNRLFFFFSYDQQKRDFPGLSIFNQVDFLNRADRALLTTPLGTNLTGGGRTTPQLQSGKGLTNAQVDQALGFLSSLSGQVPRRGDQRLILPKIDWVINNNNSFAVSYNRLRWQSPAGVQTQATNTRARDNFGDDFVEVDSLTMRLSSTITSNFLNEFRFQYGRDNEFQFSQPALPGEPTNSVNGRSPQVNITNGFTFGIPEFLERAAFPNETRWQFANTMTLTSGNHTFKFGGDINRVTDEINNLRFAGGEFNYTGGTNALGFNAGLNDFIIDYTNFRNGLAAATSCYSSTRTRGRCYGGNFNQGFGVLGLTFNTIDYNAFFQDDWRISPQLTLNLGLRYEYQKNPEAINVNPLLPQTANIPNDKNNFGPRVGFAYDLTGDGKTSVRAGYGIYYGRIINSTIYNALVNTGVGIDRGQRQVTVTATNAIAPEFPNLISAGTLTTPAVQYFDPEFGNPLIHQYDFIVEREIARNTVISASFVGSIGKNLPTFVDTNLSLPTAQRTINFTNGPFAGGSTVIDFFPTARPNTNFAQITEIRSSITSQYKALVLQANRRFTDGLQFQTNYTLSRATDNGQTSTTFTSNNIPFNAFNPGIEQARANFDSPHKFTASVVWTPDFFGDQGDSKVGRAVFNGFTIAPVFYAFSGSPYTGGISVSGAAGPGGINQSGGFNRLPDLPRNSFRRPKIVNFDLRLSRRFRFDETKNLEFLVEGFNIFNRTQVTNVNTTFYTVTYPAATPANPNPAGTAVFNSAFGNTTEAGATLFRERQVQLAVRFQF
ncbi:MAG TPA: carboxypeptidase regulatory-like domain-containing protein [Pyrinomonadaceae bacterium]|nr:carboxypeptidase regulatory-like domain-containing protein [Pyrinomonadaceae bacterium]